MIARFLLAGILMFGAFNAWGALLNPVVGDNEISGQIELPGNVKAELTIRFEKVIGLNLDNLGLSIHQVNVLDSTLLNRLPSVNNGLLSLAPLSVPAAFPVLIRIDPPSEGGLAFEGVVEVEIYTQNLQYLPGSPIRLFTAPSSTAPFHDITDMLGGGSVRTRSGGGHFSDFLIVLESRTLPVVIQEKFDHLSSLLDEHALAIPPLLLDQMLDLFDTAYLAWDSGQPGQAMQLMSTLQTLSQEAAALGQLDNVWRSTRDIRNIDGELRSAARTLRFSLSLASNLP